MGAQHYEERGYEVVRLERATSGINNPHAPLQAMRLRGKTPCDGDFRPAWFCSSCAGKRLEIAAGTAQDRLMDQGHINAPNRWREALARSEAELARGELVPGQAVHDELRRALAELEAELAEPDESASPHQPGR